VAYFPVVGLIIGLILVALNWVLGLFLPSSIVIALLLAAMVLVNGVLHLDGFIDTCDGLAGNKTAEERWRVMRDSRVGAFGIAGAALLILAKYVSFTNVPDRLMPGALLLMAVLSRWAMAYAIVVCPYARPSGLGTAFKKEADGVVIAAATFFAVVSAIGIAAVQGIPYPFVAALVTMAAVWLITTVWARYLSWKFAGLTGDSYGAVNEVTEAVVIIIVSTLAFNDWLWV
jgi:adenosylcobinamide-GDP ribazoletransferase